ncbi:hypothetical protein [Neobacillus drentensis]|uniref:hypothetical protein n=1 Tax=Neobacillus drentensis TaxID=220684 RepID=UPI0008262F99|nr:hypothetical protein [Neobacillus drentensis]
MGGDKFSAALDLLKGFEVNLFVGEDIFKGKLIGVEADHVVLETENNYIFYYNIDKIQAITKNTRKFQPEKTTANFQKTQSLVDLLQSFQHTWVTILSINKQRFTGVLSEIDEDFATLINGEERILIKLTHVANILKGFIKDETDKKSSSNEKEKNNKNSDNDKDSKDKSSSSGDKDDSKKEEKSKSESKDDTKNSDKKQKSEKNEKNDKKQDAIVMEESNNTMVWSQPIKIEATMVQTKDETFSTPVKTKKSSHAEEKDSSKTSSEMKKSKEQSTRDKKSEETKSSKSKESDQSIEIKPVKESVSFQNNDNTPAPPLKLQNSEVKSTKTQDASNPVKTFSIQNQATKKPENKVETKTNDTNTNSSSQNVWKQKEQEKKVFRFAGEPANEDNQRAFPFAGWPNRNNRATRF